MPQIVYMKYTIIENIYSWNLRISREMQLSHLINTVEDRQTYNPVYPLYVGGGK